ncbi:protein of unknown function [Xenorhabdus poinarii G6]|uniref:Uncharacterized protein n=1 Tax=Xenorhabdus poinarii G6 TaxID=1354304 RepID=A0A068QZQ8_9GAMM|nr:protein of unknown function [Xenorhabdus poinarii G6]
MRSVWENQHLIAAMQHIFAYR